jgi:hypothetical protein
MAVSWPTGVNTMSLVGIRDKRLSAKIRSPMDVGPAVVRRRYTVAVRNVDIPLTMTNAERVLFETWYASVALEGTISFLYPDPITDVLVAMRFRGDEGPEFSASVGGPTDAEKRWDVVLQVEILP